MVLYNTVRSKDRDNGWFVGLTKDLGGWMAKRERSQENLFQFPVARLSRKNDRNQFVRWLLVFVVRSRGLMSDCLLPIQYLFSICVPPSVALVELLYRWDCPSASVLLSRNGLLLQVVVDPSYCFVWME